MKTIIDFITFLFKSFLSFFRDQKLIVEPQIAIERIKICEKCEHLKGRTRSRYECLICKCRVRSKAKYVHASCPLEKW